MISDSQKELVAPQNIDAEKTVLGTLLADCGAGLEHIRDVLSPDDFYLGTHRIIYRAMVALPSGKPFDLVLLAEELNRRNTPVPAATLAELADHGTASALLHKHAVIIRDKATDRKLSALLHETLESLSSGKRQDVDWLALKSHIESMANGTSRNDRGPRAPVTVKISDVERENVTWLWSDRIPLGKLTLIEGNPGLGKSWLTLAIAAATSKGYALPGGRPERPANAVLMTAEDGLGDTVKPRLEDMEADLTRVTALRAMMDKDGHEQFVTLRDLDVIEKVITAEKPALVIVDPIIAYTSTNDTNKAHEVRSLLSPLAALAEKHHCAVVAVRHLNKSSAQALYRGQGSIDFIAACRSAFVVGENPDDAQERVLCHLKSNLAAKTSSLAFVIDKGRFLWKGTSELTAEQVLAQPVSGDRSATDEAADFLKNMLASGPMGAAEMIKEAKKLGITDKPLRSAREKLGIRPSKDGFRSGWIWRLPAQGAQYAHEGRFPDKGILASSGHLRDSDEQWEEIK
jgi:archaellum biogenesis ATPase FlaH